ncbi:MAG TPA: hypothetical protein VNT01_10820 [Symbiobacteriaceae bacterium]|nr:hypothetical protein [Symbiobacteriaceae bacterium]
MPTPKKPGAEQTPKAAQWIAEPLKAGEVAFAIEVPKGTTLDPEVKSALSNLVSTLEARGLTSEVLELEDCGIHGGDHGCGVKFFRKGTLSDQITRK